MLDKIKICILLMDSLKILSTIPEETMISIIDACFNYLKDKESIQIQKLSLPMRVPFSCFYDYMKRSLGSKLIRDIENDLKKVFKSEAIIEKIKSLYEDTASIMAKKTNLLKQTVNKENPNELGGYTNSYPLITLSRNRLKKIEWKINVVIVQTEITRVLRPEIIFEIVTSDNILHKVEMTHAQF